MELAYREVTTRNIYKYSSIVVDGGKEYITIVVDDGGKW